MMRSIRETIRPTLVVYQRTSNVSALFRRASRLVCWQLVERRGRHFVASESRVKAWPAAIVALLVGTCRLPN